MKERILTVTGKEKEIEKLVNEGMKYNLSIQEITEPHTNCKIMFGSGKQTKDKFDIVVLRKSK